MPVGLKAPQNLMPVNGIKLAVASSGVRYKDRSDLALMELAPDSAVAAVFTQNKFRAAPVNLCLEHLQLTQPRYLIINAGNANAGTGRQGELAATQTAEAVAQLAKVNKEQVLVFSTGVIGEPLDTNKIIAHLPACFDHLDQGNWLQASEAIMTTDTVAKAYSEKIPLAAANCTITGIVKGSGMIQPNMATMLAFIATDLSIKQATLKKILADNVELSFNSITVDGDTSTNDSCVLIATGKSNLAFEDLTESDQAQFKDSLSNLMQQLAQAIIRDGEGASKFVTIKVSQAISYAQAKAVASSVANSPLVKTALAASDPNWGRIMSAVGNTHVSDLDVSKAQLFINHELIWDKDQISNNYTEALGKRLMQADEIQIDIVLGLGGETATVWTTDLTHEYIRINADYRT